MKQLVHKGSTVSPVMGVPSKPSKPYRAWLRAPNRKLALSLAAAHQDIAFQPRPPQRLDGPPVRAPKDNRMLLEDLMSTSKINKPGANARHVPAIPPRTNIEEPSETMSSQLAIPTGSPPNFASASRPIFCSVKLNSCSTKLSEPSVSPDIKASQSPLPSSISPLLPSQSPLPSCLSPKPTSSSHHISQDVKTSMSLLAPSVSSRPSSSPRPIPSRTISRKSESVEKSSRKKCGVTCDWNTEDLDMVKNPNLFPEHSLLVRWPCSQHINVHTPHAVAHIMNRFGLINYIGKVGANSVVVVMKDVKSAQRVVNNIAMATDISRLIVDWLFPHMNSLAEQNSSKAREAPGPQAPQAKKDSESSKKSLKERHFLRTQDFVSSALDTYCTKMEFDLRQDFIP